MAKEERFEKIYSQGALTTTEIWETSYFSGYK